MGYVPQRLADFTVEEIALGFIDAQVEQGLADANEQQTYYYFTNTKYDDDPVRIRIEASSFAARDQLTRANVIHALNLLPITLLHNGFFAGVDFYETYHRQLLYTGTFYRDDTGTLGRTIPNGNITQTSTSRRRASSHQRLHVQQSNVTGVVLTASYSDISMELKFYHVGSRLSKVGYFSTILQAVFDLGLSGAGERVDSASITADKLPAWVFIRTVSDTTFPFEVYHALAILEALARWAVQQGQYREVLFDFFVDGKLVSGGCVTMPSRPRQWCMGLRGENSLGLFGDFKAISTS